MVKKAASQLMLGDQFIPYDPSVFESLKDDRVVYVTLDIETDTTPDHEIPKIGLTYLANLDCIGLAWRDPDGKIQSGAVTREGLADPAYKEFLTWLFQNKVIVAHSASFDLRGLGRLGIISPQKVWCTLVTERIINPEFIEYSLLKVAGRYAIPYSTIHSDYKNERGGLHKLPSQDLAEYCLMDCKLTLQIQEAQMKLVEADPKLAELINWENRAVQMYGEMGNVGMRIDEDYARKRMREFSATEKASAAKLREAGCLMPNSPPHRVKFIYEVLGAKKPLWEGWDGELFTENGNKRHHRAALENTALVVELEDLSVNTDLILDFASPESSKYLGSDKQSIVMSLYAYMKSSWFLNALKGLMDHARIDGRVHSEFAIATETGRRVSRTPNLQNLKMDSGSDDGIGDLTGVFIGRDETTLVALDLAGAELRISAVIAGDAPFAEAIKSSDFHSEMARIYFGKEHFESLPKADQKMLRRLGKGVTFAGAYGAGAPKIAQMTGMTLDDVKKMLFARDQRFSSTAHWKEIAIDRVKKEHKLRLWTGRVVGVDSPHKSWNFICQGGVGELIKRAAVVLHEMWRDKKRKSRIAGEVHDSLILEIHHSEWEIALWEARRVLELAIPQELNERTAPFVMDWPTDFDLSGNASKWGRNQLHFPIADAKPDSVDDQEILGRFGYIRPVSQPDATLKIDLESQPDLRAKPRYVFEFNLAHRVFSIELKEDPRLSLRELGKTTQEALLGFYLKVLSACLDAKEDLANLQYWGDISIPVPSQNAEGKIEFLQQTTAKGSALPVIDWYLAAIQADQNFPLYRVTGLNEKGWKELQGAIKTAQEAAQVYQATHHADPYDRLKDLQVPGEMEKILKLQLWLESQIVLSVELSV